MTKKLNFSVHRKNHVEKKIFIDDILERFDKAGYSTLSGTNTFVLASILNEMLVDYDNHLKETLIKDSFWHSTDLERCIEYARENYGAYIKRPVTGAFVDISKSVKINFMQRFGGYTFLPANGLGKTFKDETVFLEKGIPQSLSTVLNTHFAAPIKYSGKGTIAVKHNEVFLTQAKTKEDGTYEEGDFYISFANKHYYLVLTESFIEKNENIATRRLDYYTLKSSQDPLIAKPLDGNIEYYAERDIDIEAVRNYIRILIKSKKTQLVSVDDIETAIKFQFKCEVKVQESNNEYLVFVDTGMNSKDNKVTLSAVKKFIVDNSLLKSSDIKVKKLIRVVVNVEISSPFELDGENMQLIASEINNNSKFIRCSDMPFNNQYLINKILIDLGLEDFSIEICPENWNFPADEPILSILSLDSITV